MVMEMALAFVQLHSYIQVTNLVLLSLSLPLRAYLHLLGIPVPASSLASSYSYPLRMKLRYWLFWGAFFLTSQAGLASQPL